ncbi:hypothetical protein GGR54DRAFT_636858 [Hypoxylon sp. NC1633]|nr:hypothetical protein GGR54DRAFT_636858 [Hypoxylon sp. NC1633]
MENAGAKNHASNVTCLSTEHHPHNISDRLLHYLGCIAVSERENFFDTANPLWQEEVERRILLGRDPDNAQQAVEEQRESWEADCDRELRRIDILRNTLFHDEDQKHLVENLNQSRSGWWEKKKWLDTHPIEDGTEVVGDFKLEEHIVVSTMHLKNGVGVDLKDDERVRNRFPNQEMDLGDFISRYDKKNPLYKGRFAGSLRYFHIPSNNMTWAENAIRRYYGVEVEYDAPSNEVARRRMQSNMILQESCWRSQMYDIGQPHLRHMRPFCATISSGKRQLHAAILINKSNKGADPENNDPFPNNMALFMPYLYWDTSRKREYFAKEIDRRFPKSRSKIHSMGGLMKKMDMDTDPLEVDNNGRVKVASPLGQYLLDATRLYEGMSNYCDRKVIRQFISEEPPLHPRRTLDQAYFWKLGSTRKRDRDQVVYRKTTASPGNFHIHLDKEEALKRLDGSCEMCTANIQKISRVIMVDQLWLWILDAQTIITSFPDMYGSNARRSCGVYRSVKSRAQVGGTGRIRTVFDLALEIIDECSDAMFGCAKAADHRPQLIDAFSEAIGSIMHKQTSAFEALLLWTEEVNKVYKSNKLVDMAGVDVTVLNIKREALLQRDIKDIVEELEIMLHITRTQRKLFQTFIENAENILDPFGRFRGDKGREKRARLLWERSPKKTVDLPPEGDDSTKTKREQDKELDYHFFRLNAEEYRENVQSRIEKLQELHDCATSTADNVKSLIELKQQQASVVQAWQATKQSEETIRQGRSIMIFTLVTIIFLPLSFMSSVFGMNNVEFSGGTWEIGDELFFMLIVSAVVILVSLVLAFIIWIRAAVYSAWKSLERRIYLQSGLYGQWLDFDMPAKRLFRDATEKSDKLKNDLKLTRFQRRQEKRMEDYMSMLKEKGRTVESPEEDGRRLSVDSNGREFVSANGGSPEGISRFGLRRAWSLGREKVNYDIELAEHGGRTDP